MPILRFDLPEYLTNPPRMPQMEPPRYSAEWWQLRGAVDQWEQARTKACLIVFLELIEPNFSPMIYGDPEPSHAIRVIPEYELWLHEGTITGERAGWCYLTDALRALESDCVPNQGQLLLLSDRLAAAEKRISDAISVLRPQ